MADETELVEFLREEAAHYDKTIYKETRDKFERSADTIEALQRERDALREALREVRLMFGPVSTSRNLRAREIIDVVLPRD